LILAVAYFDFRRFQRKKARPTIATISSDVSNPTYVLALSANCPGELPSLGTKNKNKVIATQKPKETFSRSISLAYSGFSSSMVAPQSYARPPQLAASVFINPLPKR
jgi:hypothetical protein